MFTPLQQRVKRAVEKTFKNIDFSPAIKQESKKIHLRISLFGMRKIQRVFDTLLLTNCNMCFKGLG
jgi:hypothetical protein